MADELATEQETYDVLESTDEVLLGEALAMPEEYLEEVEEAEESEAVDFAEFANTETLEIVEDGGELGLSNEADDLGGQRIIIDSDEEPEKEPIPLGTKVAGAAKMVGGAALAAAAVPLVVVPIAPTSLMAVGGVTLAAKGQREFSGREISQLEVKAEAATEKITKVTKKTTGGLLSRLGEASTRAAEKLSETDWDEKLGLNEE